MGFRCEICGKGPQYGNNVSHAKNRTRRRWLPNLQTVRVKKDKQNVSIRVCTSCISKGKVVKASRIKKQISEPVETK